MSKGSKYRGRGSKYIRERTANISVGQGQQTLGWGKGRKQRSGAERLQTLGWGRKAANMGLHGSLWAAAATIWRDLL